MTAEEFEAVRQRLERRINANRLEAARLALVDGMKLQSVADRFNWSARQAVNDIVRIACDDLAEYRKLVAWLHPGKTVEVAAKTLPAIQQAA